MKILIKTLRTVFLLVLIFTGAFAFCKTPNIDTSSDAQFVRISKIEVEPAMLKEYNEFLKEEILTSMKLESGVLTLFAVCEKSAPQKITILEIYKNLDAYKAHIKTPHFLKYKNGTSSMVKSLDLIDVTPLISDLKIK